MKGRAKGEIWALLYDPKARSYFTQGLVLLLVLWVGCEVVTNTVANLERQNIASGFGFMEERAGFSIIQTLVPYSEDSTYGRAFVVGLLNTLLVAIIGIVLATILGFLVGLGRLSSNPLISSLSGGYIEIIRNIPPLLQIFFWYFAVLRALPTPRNSLAVADTVYLNNRGLFAPNPIFEKGFEVVALAFLVGVAIFAYARVWAATQQRETGKRPSTLWIGLGALAGLPLLAFLAMGAPLGFEMPAKTKFNLVGGLKIIPELIALILALSTYTAAFIAEVVRSGVLAVQKGQSEAARSLGLSEAQTLRLVVVPQALRVIVPPLTNQYLNLTKNSSLAVAIAYPDLVSVFAGIVLNQTGQAVEVLVITMAVYLTLSLLTSMIMNWYNARIALTER